MDVRDEQKIRQLLSEYLRRYCSCDDRLTGYLNDDFTGFIRGGYFLGKDRVSKTLVAFSHQRLLFSSSLAQATNPFYTSSSP